ncbi:small subunit ribosomal protein S15 [Entomortierella parvispora]|uniref:Small subunit ribosomal protein S15 n=1 Tax=Entomortierella parvispora TaxID=205924 RepID=A0A9P3LU24_9FUNG|nr:small subunit ribosomal protein S15 [Entomortierella parvispora]
MFGLRSALPGARSIAVSSKPTTAASSFHTSASALARPRRSRKDIVIQVRKSNLQKQELKRLEVENSTPDYIIGKETEFTRSLLRPQSVFQAPLAAIKPVTDNNAAAAPATTASSSKSAFSFSPSSSSPLSSSIFGSSSSRTPLVVSTSEPSGYQHFLEDQEVDLLFNKVPEVQVQELMVRSTLVNEKNQLPIEKQKAELVRRITALENGNAKQLTLENVRRARLAFQRMEGDTGSPEVQAAVMTVRIQNLHNHIQNNKKDKHNYRRLRMLIHQRQTVLKYLKKAYPDRYHVCLDRLGLEPRAIEDEIVV